MPTVRFTLPLPLPGWLHRPLKKVKRALIPPAPLGINIDGERNVEWSFLSAEMPEGPGEAIEFGCENGYMSLVAATKGYRVVANDLQKQSFAWEHPGVEFREGDFLKLELPSNFFDVAINCSSVEHVGIAGRYGIRSNESDGDLEVMRRLAQVLKANGRLLMTAPCGRDTVMAPWCRVYGPERLPRLFEDFAIEREEYWLKNERNQWARATRKAALEFEPRHDATNPHGCAYALGCFVLRKAPRAK
jgi:SAM-dependent methyltransferase